MGQVGSSLYFLVMFNVSHCVSILSIMYSFHLACYALILSNTRIITLLNTICHN